MPNFDIKKMMILIKYKHYNEFLRGMFEYAICKNK